MKGTNEYQTFQKIIKLDYSIPAELEPSAQSLIKDILVLDTKQRPTIAQLFKRDFFVNENLSDDLVHTLEAPQMSFLEPLKLPGTNIDNLYMDPDAYFQAQAGISNVNISSKSSDSSTIPPESLDSWLPDLSATNLAPNSVLFSSIVKKV